jgi:ABC-type nitrate/sulfonate/bicarbonate transport system permease component
LVIGLIGLITDWGIRRLTMIVVPWVEQKTS